MNWKIGVIENRKEPALATPWTVTASDNFVTRIARRYAASELSVSHAELALAYQRPGEVNYFQDAQLSVSPQFSFREHLLFAPVRREIAAGPRGARETQVAKLYERLFLRQERVTSIAAGGAPGIFKANAREHSGDRVEMRPLAGFSTTRPEPVERIVREAPREDRAAKPASSQVPDSDSGWGTPITSAAAPKPFTLPAAEVKRVTEQVIREIDHRIVARRERMGRRS